MPLAFETHETAIRVAAELAQLNRWRYRVHRNDRGYWEVSRAGRRKTK